MTVLNFFFFCEYVCVYCVHSVYIVCGVRMLESIVGAWADKKKNLLPQQQKISIDGIKLGIYIRVYLTQTRPNSIADAEN